MSKEQIEEMAFDLCRIDTCKHLPQEECNNTTCAHCEAEALYKAGYRKQEWISVEERLPDIRQKVLLYSPTDGMNIGHRLDEAGRFYVGKAYPDRPTHWMPLPPPPTSSPAQNTIR